MEHMEHMLKAANKYVVRNSQFLDMGIFFLLSNVCA